MYLQHPDLAVRRRPSSKVTSLLEEKPGRLRNAESSVLFGVTTGIVAVDHPPPVTAPPPAPR